MNRKIWTEDEISIITAYLRNRVPIKQIAKKFDVTPDSIYGIIRRNDLSEQIIPRPSTKLFMKNIDFVDLQEENFEELKKKSKLQWEIKKSTRKNKNKTPFKTALFWPDTHIPHHNPIVVKSILKLMDDVIFDKMVICGDYMDLGCISHWNRNRHKTLEMKRLKADYVIGNSLLDEIDKRLPKNCDKHFLEGNHEVWAKDLLEEIPALEGLVEPESLLYLKERNYKFYEYNKLIRFGRLNITHGMFAGASPIKKHMDELKVNILFGHTHTLGMQLFCSSARQIAFAGYNIGCVCDLSPDYMKNKANKWTHGFAVGYFYENGYFDIELIRVVNGRFVFNSKMYDGNI